MGTPIEEGMCERLLPPALLRKGIITEAAGVQVGGYEEWLIELINASRAFMSQTRGEPFKRPESEAHGEADAITKAYSLDFKLLTGHSLMHAMREMSAQKVICDGSILTETSRRTGEMRGLALHKALRSLRQADLRRIWNAGSEEALLDNAEKEIFGFYQTLKKPKNLLLLLPFLLYMKDASSLPTAAASSLVYKDFAGSIALRRELCAGYENYVAYLADGRLVVIQADEVGWRQFDAISITESPMLMQLLRAYDLADYAQLNSLLGIR